MLGRKERGQLELFITGSLRQLVPDDYILARVDRVLDLSWLRDEVAELYCADNGRPGIDPEVALRLMLAGLLLGIVHDRKLMREAQVNLAIRWFIGYGLHEELPDHSSLTRIRQRWGAERFRRIFQRTVQACIAAKIATGKIVHVDASLIRADVSREGLAVQHVDAVAEANDRSDDYVEVARIGRSASPIQMRRWRPMGGTAAWSRPTSSMRSSMTFAAWCSTSRQRRARSMKAKSCSGASMRPRRRQARRSRP